MNKQEQIAQYKLKPFEVGDEVNVNVPYVKVVGSYIKIKGKKDKEWVTEHVDCIFSAWGHISEVLDGSIMFTLGTDSQSVPYEIHGSYNKTFKVANEHVEYDVRHIGADHFVEKVWGANMQFYQGDIEQLLWRMGFDSRERKFKHETLGDIVIPELNWDSTVINADGEEVVYQRPFVWTLPEKQLLIDSIYNGIEIGKFVFRSRSWSWVENRVKRGLIERTAFKDIVDGKQRGNAILGFVTDEFPDRYGDYFSDLSGKAQRKFFSSRNLTYGELGEATSDKETLGVFMMINHSGVLMSKEHLDYVKEIHLK